MIPEKFWLPQLYLTGSLDQQSKPDRTRQSRKTNPLYCSQQSLIICFLLIGDGTGDTAVSGGLGLRSNVIAGGSNGNGGGNNVITAQLGIKNLVHDVQLKRQKEIRDMMKKKREKAVLVDRISRWLFPTSFILLNIVYWALFGDHELW